MVTVENSQMNCLQQQWGWERKRHENILGVIDLASYFGELAVSSKEHQPKSSLWKLQILGNGESYSERLANFVVGGPESGF